MTGAGEGTGAGEAGTGASEGTGVAAVTGAGKATGARPGPGRSVPVHSDPGLQPERTTLSWIRTGMALVVVSALFLRWYQYQGLATVVLYCLSLVIAGVIVVSLRRRHHNAVVGIADDRLPAAPLAVLMTTATVIMVGALGIYIVIT